MSLILNIDTSIETASVSIAKDGMIQYASTNNIQKEHAGFLHTAVGDLLTRSSLDIKELDAIAVTIGPGSYTGLRVGLASAKGFCYALNKPLLTIGTLPAMAASAIHNSNKATAFFCPMIDARRMEIYTAVYDHKLAEILAPCAMVLNEISFAQRLLKNEVFFFGSGSVKWSKIINSENALFISNLDIAPALAQLSFNKYLRKNFTDLIYSVPLYIKEFHIS